MEETSGSVHRSEGGFTMVELMVVVLILAILIAIAIPTFLTARHRAQDGQAKSHLRAALVAQKIHYSADQQYADDVGTGLVELRAIEPNLAWDSSDAAIRGVDVEDISGAPYDGQGLVMRSLSRSKTLFCIADTAVDFSYGYPGITRAGTYYAKAENADASTRCNAATVVWEAGSSGWN